MESIPQVNLKNYTFIKVLGHGSYGRVVLIKENSTEKLFAAKESFKEYDENDKKQDFNKEMAIYSSVDSPTLLKVYGYSITNFESRNNPVIVIEFMPNSSLDKHLTNKDRICRLTPKQKYIILLGITIGMRTLHSNGIIHRDLKPGNILLDENFYPYLADFGISFISDLQASQILMNTQVGTPLYQAPEILSDEPYTPSVDVYSYSLIAYQLLTDKMIFSEYKSVFRMQLDIINGIRPDLSMITDPNIKSFLEKGWSSDPSARPTFDEILEEIIDDRYKNYFGISQSEFDKYMSQFNDDILDRNTSSKLVSELKKKVRSGDSESMFRLALIYDLGESGIKVDKKKAIDLYRMACENNNADAMLVYGKKLLFGEKDGIEVNKKEAAEIYKKFADMHNMKAMNNYGLMLLYGNGINKNEKLAEKYLKEAADLGNPKAMLAYANMLYKGNGIAVDKKKAAKYYRLSADQGNERAMSKYASMCREGDGIDVNVKEAVRVFKLFINKGNAIAMFNYGMMLLLGKEVHGDKKLAAKMMKGAADQDDPDAMFIYGVMLYEGDGTEINKIDAVKYLKKSALMGNKDAKAFIVNKYD